MDDNKDVKSRKVNLKNRKVATQALAKTSNKKSSTKKTQITKTTAKSKTVTKEIVKAEEVKSINLEEEKKVLNKNEVPTQTKKGAEKKSKEKGIENDKTTKTVKKTTSKTTTRKPKKVVAVEKTKLEIPKQWQDISIKQKKAEEPEKNIGSKLKRSIFEEIDEKEFIEKKKKEKEQLKRTIITFLIIIIVVVSIILIVFKFNEGLKKQFTKYDVYKIGDKVKLSDESIWYVVEDDGERSETVRIIANGVLDINSDGVINNDDAMMYNSDNVAEYDESNNSSTARYLSVDYKNALENKIGKVENVRLLTSKEYVTIRDKMGFGYEWTTQNWLANEYLENWWVISSQNNKVYAITSVGTYRLFSPTAFKFVRPTVELKKDMITLIESSETKVEGMASKIKKLSEFEN